MYIELKRHGGGRDDNGPTWIGRVLGVYHDRWE